MRLSQTIHQQHVSIAAAIIIIIKVTYKNIMNKKKCHNAKVNP
jgi:hypothetical protein